MIPVLLILGIGIGAIAWYARSNYFVGANRGRVTVYKGVPGGLLWLDPTIDHRSNLLLSDLRPVDAVNVRRGEQTFGSKSDADAYIRRIRAKGESATTTTTTTTTTHPSDDHHDQPSATTTARCRPEPGPGDAERGQSGPMSGRDRYPGRRERAIVLAPRAGRHERASMSERSVTARRRRTNELGLGLLAVVIMSGGYVLLLLAEKPDLPPDLWLFLVAVLGLYLVAHLAVRRFAPRADPTLLPIAALLNGIGFITISRLDRDLARVQAGWTAVAVVAFVVVLVGVRHIRTLERYRYTFLLLGVAALLLPLLPGVGREINGARLWVRVGPLNFQPGEAAKVLLVIFFAAYLVDKRELLKSGTRRFLGMALPDPKHLGPLLLAWSFSILVMVRQKDLGSSLLFFAVFAAMLYIATERGSYLIVAFGDVRRGRRGRLPVLLPRPGSRRRVD